MIKELILSKNRELTDKLLFFFFSIYPVAFLIGNFLINFFTIIFFFLFFISILSKKIKINDESKILIYLLLFLFITLLINLIFSNNFSLTYPRVIKFFLIIGSILAFRQLIESYNKNEINLLYKIWSIIFFVVVADLIFEYLFKTNTLGFKSIIPGRLTSFTGKEMIIGHFFSAFVLIVLSFVHLNYKNKYLDIILSISFIILSFLIGERSNFIKTFIIINLFLFFIVDIKLRFKLISVTLVLLFFISYINFNQHHKVRYFDQIYKLINKGGINLYLEESYYGAHYKVATEIFKDNTIFGVGIKNFRIESYSKKYEDLDHKHWDRRGNTHPHQIHYEFLSETGLFGYLTFTIFIFLSLYLFFKSYKKNKNIYQFSGMLFVLVNLIPLLPSGSFFSTYSAGLFWINYSIMMGYIEKN